MCCSLDGESYDSTRLPSNQSIADRLAYGQVINSSSGATSTDTGFTETLSVILVNPSSTSQTATLDMSLSPQGPCQACNQMRNQQGFLGECFCPLTSLSFIQNHGPQFLQAKSSGTPLNEHHLERVSSTPVQ